MAIFPQPNNTRFRPGKSLARLEGSQDGPAILKADEDDSSYWTMIAHFAYGGATGALFALQSHWAPLAGVGYGIGVWVASYLGWIPVARILVPATRHPMRRKRHDARSARGVGSGSRSRVAGDRRSRARRPETADRGGV